MNSENVSNTPIDPGDAIFRFASQISHQQPGLVDYRPEDWAKPHDCIKNVDEMIGRFGGQPLYGWYFQVRFAEFKGHYLIAVHHAVWVSESRSVVDITPVDSDPKLQPYMVGGRVLFLVDLSADPLTCGCRVAPRQSRFFGITKTPSMNAHISQLVAEEDMRSDLCLRGKNA